MTGRTLRLHCLECSVVLGTDDREHYGYHCHACAMREHDLVLTWRRDPDHPEASRLFEGPVDLGLQVLDRAGVAPGGRRSA